MSLGAVRIVLHTGKGGVGKTTVSAATAIAAAAAGHRTLLLSTDPAHSVADVLGVAVGAEPVLVAEVPGLWAAQVDTRMRLEQAWSGIRSYLVGVLAARGMEQVQAEELTVLPGADEIVALLEVHRHATDPAGRFDVIVVDCAPSGESLKLLAMPETIRFYADRLASAPARLMRSLRRSGPLDEVTDGLGDLLDRLAEARNLLADNNISGIRIVLTPERVVIAEARRLLTALALHGFAVEAVVVNRLLTPESAQSESLLADWQAAQAANMPLIDESFGGLPVLRVPLTGREPVGIAALGAIAGQMFDGGDPVADPVPAAALRTEGTDGRYRLLIALPLADRGEIRLSRTDGDLMVTVDQHRRRITLPSVLQRCRTTGAEFTAQELVIHFEADPDSWPATLSAALAGAR